MSWQWPAFRLGVAFLLLASIAVGISVPLGPIQAVQTGVAVCLIGISVFALIAADVQSVLRLAVASAFGAFAVFGLLMPWGACEAFGTALVGRAVCPVDCDLRRSTQESRLRWAAALALGVATLAFVPQHIFDGGATSILGVLLADVKLLVLTIGL